MKLVRPFRYATSVLFAMLPVVSSAFSFQAAGLRFVPSGARPSVCPSRFASRRWRQVERGGGGWESRAGPGSGQGRQGERVGNGEREPTVCAEMARRKGVSPSDKYVSGTKLPPIVGLTDS